MCLAIDVVWRAGEFGAAIIMVEPLSDATATDAVVGEAIARSPIRTPSFLLRHAQSIVRRMFVQQRELILLAAQNSVMRAQVSCRPADEA